MLVGSRYKLDQLVKIPDIRIRNNSVGRVFKSKSLEVIIDNVLLWSAHVAHITKKVNKAINGMKQILSSLYLVFNKYFPKITANRSRSISTNLSNLTILFFKNEMNDGL